MELSWPVDGASTTKEWTSPAFADALRRFVEVKLGPSQMTNTKLRPWSTVWRVVASDGVFWLKQNAPGARFEASLVLLLAAAQPERVVRPVAIDAGSGLLLTYDEGPVKGQGSVDVSSWCRMAQQWAALQLTVSYHTAAIAELGVTALHPADSLEYLATRMRQSAVLPPHDPRRLTVTQQEVIQRSLPRIRRAMAEVAACGLPISLNHNDLHGNNMFSDSDPLRFFDFGDATLGDPAASLLVPLRSAQENLGCSPNDPRLHRIADAWIEIWTHLRPARELRKTLHHSLRLASLPRAETWLRLTPSMSPSELAQWGEAWPYWLAAIAEDPLLSHT